MPARPTANSRSSFLACLNRANWAVKTGAVPAFCFLLSSPLPLSLFSTLPLLPPKPPQDVDEGVSLKGEQDWSVLNWRSKAAGGTDLSALAAARGESGTARRGQLPNSIWENSISSPDWQEISTFFLISQELIQTEAVDCFLCSSLIYQQVRRIAITCIAEHSNCPAFAGERDSQNAVYASPLLNIFFGFNS